MRPVSSSRARSIRRFVPLLLPLSCMAAPQAFADVIAEHAVVQQGLAIALASNVLQGHLIYVSAALGEYNGWVGECTALDDTDIHSGGVTAVADPPGAGQNFPALVHVGIYYDGTCATPYMTADVALTETLVGSTTAYSVTDLHTHYFAVDGVSPLATLTTTATVSYDTDTSTLALHGLGAFAGTASPASASLGLVCGTASDAVDLDCAGGIVQDFPSLGVALGSVSPLTLVANDGGSLDF